MPDRPLFHFDPKTAIVPVSVPQDMPKLKELIEDDLVPIMSLPGGAGAVSLLRTTDPKAASDLDQFVVFQLNPESAGPRILDPTQVQCSIAGTSEEPDISMAISLEAFHLGQNEAIGKDSRATMRVIVGKDEASTDDRFDTLFWAITSGLKLYDDYKKQASSPRELRTDFKQALGGRPAEIPGSLALLQFQVIKHESEPTWWQRVFTFLRSPAGSAVVAALGFPAIGTSAISFLDEALNRLYNAQPKVLFGGDPMTYALSTRARDLYTGGQPNAEIGALTSGFCVMARRRDYSTIAGSGAIFNKTYGVLIPEGVSDADYHSGNYVDPFKDISYAVLHLGMRATHLDSSLWSG